MERQNPLSLIFSKGPELGVWILRALLLAWAMHSPLTHDELSGLTRAGFNSFGQLILNGVLPDAHPPLTQVLIWICIQLGMPVVLLKGIFGLFAGWAVALIYRMGRSLGLNDWVSLIAVLGLSSTGYFLTYSGMIRPYIMGLPFCLAFMNSLLPDEEGSPRGDVWKTVCFGLLASGTHYMAGLSIALYLCLGPLWLARGYWKTILMRAWWMLFFGAPLLPFLYKQAQHKGLGWLSPPNWDFLFAFADYLAGFQTWMLVPLALVMGLAIWQGRKNKLILGSLAAFFLVYLIQHVYSLLVAPILQFSGLFFLFPGVMIILISGLKLPKKYLVSLGIGTWFLIIGGNLIFRPFYRIYTNQPFHQSQQWIQNEIPSIVGLNPTYIEWFGPVDNFVSVYGKENPEASIQDFLIKNQISQLQTVGLEPRLYGIIMEAGFRVKGVENYYSAQAINWVKNMGQTDGIGQNFPIDSTRTFLPVKEMNLSETLKNRHDYLEIGILTPPDYPEMADLMLVAEVWRGNEPLDYVNLAVDAIGQNATVIPFNGYLHSDAYFKEARIKVYLWNRGKGNLGEVEFYMNPFPGNPYRFALFQEME